MAAATALEQAGRARRRAPPRRPLRPRQYRRASQERNRYPQLTAMRQISAALGWQIVGEYRDEGYSGTLPLDARPDGAGLLADAAAGGFDSVSTITLIASRAPSASAGRPRGARGTRRVDPDRNEPFDTAAGGALPVSTLLGGMAELDADAVMERLTLGRDRHAKQGRWLGRVPSATTWGG